MSTIRSPITASARSSNHTVNWSGSTPASVGTAEASSRTSSAGRHVDCRSDNASIARSTIPVTVSWSGPTDTTRPIAVATRLTGSTPRPSSSAVHRACSPAASPEVAFAGRESTTASRSSCQRCRTVGARPGRPRTGPASPPTAAARPPYETRTEPGPTPGRRRSPRSRSPAPATAPPTGPSAPTAGWRGTARTGCAGRPSTCGRPTPTNGRQGTAPGWRSPHGCAA